MSTCFLLNLSHGYIKLLKINILYLDQQHLQKCMKLIKILTIFALFQCLPAFAQSNINDTVKIVSIMKKYAETVSCGYDIQPKNVVNMTHSQNIDNPIYYVLWRGDIGCAGGSGTTSMEITSVEKNRLMDSGYIISVYPVLDENVYYELNPRFIESLNKNSDDQIQVITWLPVNDEELNYPSKKVKFTLKRTEQNAPWEIVNRTLIQIKN